MLPRLVLDYLRSAAAREWVRQGTSGRGEDICHDPARVAHSKCNLPPRANHMSTVIMLAWRGAGRASASVIPGVPSNLLGNGESPHRSPCFNFRYPSTSTTLMHVPIHQTLLLRRMFSLVFERPFLPKCSFVYFEGVGTPCCSCLRNQVLFEPLGCSQF